MPGQDKPQNALATIEQSDRTASTHMDPSTRHPLQPLPQELRQQIYRDLLLTTLHDANIPNLPKRLAEAMASLRAFDPHEVMYTLRWFITPLKEHAERHRRRLRDETIAVNHERKAIMQSVASSTERLRALRPLHRRLRYYISRGEKDHAVFSKAVEMIEVEVKVLDARGSIFGPYDWI